MVRKSRRRQVFRSRTEIYRKSNWTKFKEGVNLLFTNIKSFFLKLGFKIHEKGSQRLTVMIVPHSEKKIFNLQISNYIMFFTMAILTVTVISSVWAIVFNQSTYQEKVWLKKENAYKKVMIDEYRKSIDSLNKRFTMFKVDVNNIVKTYSKDKKMFNDNEIEFSSEFSNQNVPREIKDLEKVKSELEVTKENISRMVTFMVYQKKLLKKMPSIYPLARKARISSPYGPRVDPVYRYKKEFHPGLDMAILPGTPIFAGADGVVKLAGWHGGYGIMVELKHEYGFSTRYGHMSRLGRGIVPGAHVKQGQVIGYVGTTGKSTGYHVHYEVRIGNKTVDPQPFTTMLP